MDVPIESHDVPIESQDVNHEYVNHGIVIEDDDEVGTDERGPHTFKPLPVTIQAVQSQVRRQKAAQQKFQKQIQDLQFPGSCVGMRKLLVKSGPAPMGGNIFESFARDFHYLATALQVAVATKRTMVLSDEWEIDVVRRNNVCKTMSFVAKDGVEILSSIKSLRRISCLKQTINSLCKDHVPNQEDVSAVQQRYGQDPPDLDDPVSYAILPVEIEDKRNSIFHAKFYGQQLTVEMMEWPYPKHFYQIDVILYYERLWGRFWVRAQMVHFLWEKWHPSSSMPTTSPTAFPYYGEQHGTAAPYIAFYWIASKRMRNNLKTKFGRDPSVTQSIEEYMRIANLIRKDHHKEPTPLRTIYLITDGTNDVPIPDNVDSMWPDWQFIRLFSPSDTDDNDEEKRMIASLEVMRRATFLVGSFQSQMFRLGAELNTGWYTARYPINIFRHWTVDMEWFENP